MATNSLIQVIIDGIIFLVMACRLTFGGNPNLSGWISEVAMDLPNDILSCEEFDPNKLRSPIKSMMTPPLLLQANVKYATARQTSVDIPPEDQGKRDVYIDDTVAIVPDLPGNRAPIPLAIHLLSRPIDREEYVIRKPPISMTKLQSEARLEELKLLLG